MARNRIQWSEQEQMMAGAYVYEEPLKSCAEWWRYY